MSIDDAFKTFETTVNAPKNAVDLARKRRDFFHDALITDADVDDVIPSGSLARGTHKDPINDVDVIVIYKDDDHPEWGTDGDSAEEALTHTGSRINSLLGATNGSFAKEVRLASPRNHAVKCFLDDPDDKDAFTVDATPAFRRDGALIIAEKNSRRWVKTDPEYLIREVEARHETWRKYASSVRMLKWWASELGMDPNPKSLVMEVLALHYLPLGLTRPVALKQFFYRAHNHVWLGQDIVDPAGHCGTVQPSLDMDAFEEALSTASDLATKAFQAQSRGEDTLAHRFWKELFGDHFPDAPSSGGGGKPAVVPPVLPPRPVKDTPQG